MKKKLYRNAAKQQNAKHFFHAREIETLLRNSLDQKELEHENIKNK